MSSSSKFNLLFAKASNNAYPKPFQSNTEYTYRGLVLRCEVAGPGSPQRRVLTVAQTPNKQTVYRYFVTWRDTVGTSTLPSKVATSLFQYRDHINGRPGKNTVGTLSHSVNVHKLYVVTHNTVV